MAQMQTYTPVWTHKHGPIRQGCILGAALGLHCGDRAESLRGETTPASGREQQGAAQLYIALARRPISKKNNFRARQAHTWQPHSEYYGDSDRFLLLQFYTQTEFEHSKGELRYGEGYQVIKHALIGGKTPS